jgi:hypothetical protein
MKQGEKKVIVPFKITKMYSRVCLLELPAEMRTFSVFYHSLLRPHSNSPELPGQDKINKSESQKLQGCTYKRTDSTVNTEQRWEFETILDCHKNKNRLNYQIAWQHHKPTWQLAKDLKDNVEAVRKFHTANPTKSGPPSWAQ